MTMLDIRLTSMIRVNWKPLWCFATSSTVEQPLPEQKIVEFTDVNI